MKSTFFSRGFAILAAACIGAASAVSHTAHAFVVYVRAYIEDWRAFMTGPMEPRPGGWDSSVLVSKQAHAQARAVRAGADRRKRPTMTQRWRMCPSG